MPHSARLRHDRYRRLWPGVAVASWFLLEPAAAGAEPARFMLDPEHTSITFFTHHLGFADVAGMFLKAEGGFTYDEATRELRDLEIVIDTDSVFTNHDARDDHLRGADFFNVKEFPEMIFRGTGAEPLDERSGRVTGELTLLGVSRPVSLEVRFNRAGNYPFGDQHYAIGIDATATIRRSEFGMTYGVDGNWVGDEVRLVVGIEAIRQD